MTVEDPVEYQIDGINQTQINAKIDMTFAKALRAILRQDPDVVMVGEIRDGETAQIAIQASLTGHLVLATLHTNSAAGAVNRLLDMGVQGFLLASSLKGVVAQRLTRRLCTTCKQPFTPSSAQLELMDLKGLDLTQANFHQPKGCPACQMTGYQGRLGIYELLEVDGAMSEAIHHQASESEIATLNQAKHLTLWQEACNQVYQGETSLDEILRVYQ
jgi:general secretion pathway protein E